jgi:hypothetical protein
VVSFVVSFDCSAVFFVSFWPTGEAAKLTVVGLVVVGVDVLVCVVPVFFGEPLSVCLVEAPELAGPCDPGPVVFVEPVDLGPALAGAFG